jgi:hypothetical protein
MDVHADTPAISIVMPIFNDWAALPRLLDNLAEAFRGKRHHARCRPCQRRFDRI